MKQKFFNSIAIKNGWRVTRLALAVVLLAWFGATSSAAQSTNQRRVSSVRVGTANEGSRVTVVSDSALNDYEAYRSGDLFYLKIPAAQFASAVPNRSGAGFEDVQVQKAADSSIISFRLQPGTAARVDQRSNRLDVVFSTLGRSENAIGTTTNAAAPAQSASESRDETSGPVPLHSGSSRDGRDSSSSNSSGVGRSTSPSHFVPQQSGVGSQQVSSEATSELDPAASSPSARGTAAASPASLLAQVSPAQATTVEQQPPSTAQGTTSSRNLPVSLGQWLAQNWLPAAIVPLLVVSLPLLFVGYLRSRLKRNNQTRRSKESLAHNQRISEMSNLTNQSLLHLLGLISLRLKLPSRQNLKLNPSRWFPLPQKPAKLRRRSKLNPQRASCIPWRPNP